MLRIIILEYYDDSNVTTLVKVYLHEPVSIWEDFMYKWKQCLLQDADVHWGVHDSLRNADARSAPHTNASP